MSQQPLECLAYPCEYCGQPAGEPCIRASGRRAEMCHADRYRKWRARSGAGWSAARALGRGRR